MGLPNQGDLQSWDIEAPVEQAFLLRQDVIWINADQNIDAQLIEVAEKARWIASESDHKYKVQIAQQRIRSYSDCLIIFDNLDDRQKQSGPASDSLRKQESRRKRKTQDSTQ